MGNPEPSAKVSVIRYYACSATSRCGSVWRKSECSFSVLKVYSSPFPKGRVVTFDGDEMNFHIPQSAEATVELEEIAAVPHHIITPRHAKPMIGIYQDLSLIHI